MYSFVTSIFCIYVSYLEFMQLLICFSCFLCKLFVIYISSSCFLNTLAHFSSMLETMLPQYVINNMQCIFSNKFVIQYFYTTVQKGIVRIFHCKLNGSIMCLSFSVHLCLDNLGTSIPVSSNAEPIPSLCADGIWDGEPNQQYSRAVKHIATGPWSCPKCVCYDCKYPESRSLWSDQNRQA